jgi:hypothetical protein
MATAARSLSPRRIGRPIAPETPHQIIEGEAYEGCAELVYYRDADRPERACGDAGCDACIRRAQRALDAGDIPTAQAALREYWHHDAIEDAAAQRGDGRVAVAHAHLKAIPAAVVTIEMGATPLPTSARRGPGGRGR